MGPINEFEFLAFRSYLVAYKDSQGDCVGLIHHRPESERHIYAGKKISHAAYVNFPVEKKLEEKFEEFLKATNAGLTGVISLQSYTLGLSQIAKEHYEGKE